LSKWPTSAQFTHEQSEGFGRTSRKRNIEATIAVDAFCPDCGVRVEFKTQGGTMEGEKGKESRGESVKVRIKACWGGTERISTETDLRRGGDRILTRIFLHFNVGCNKVHPLYSNKGSRSLKKEFVILRPLNARRVSAWGACKVAIRGPGPTSPSG
jgi:hypothetical protein